MSLFLKDACSSADSSRSFLGKLSPVASSEITRAVTKQAFIFCQVVEVVFLLEMVGIAVCHSLSESLLLYPTPDEVDLQCLLITLNCKASLCTVVMQLHPLIFLHSQEEVKLTSCVQTE